jgi:hypothetical protein
MGWKHSSDSLERKRTPYKILKGNHQERRLFEAPRRMWRNSSKTILIGVVVYEVLSEVDRNRLSSDP